MSYQIGAYVPTVFLCLHFLYAGNCDEGSEKVTKKLFVGMRVREPENCLGGVG